MAAFDPKAAAKFIAEAHAKRASFQNLEGELAPPSITDAYDAQDALAEIWAKDRGPVVGRKIATTTRVMQALMGIDHPCGGLIFRDRVHRAPGALRAADYVNLMVECELAVRLDRNLDTGGPFTAENVRESVGEVMAAFELIEDRNAVYKETDARTLIADGAWNAGIVVGPSIAVPYERDLNGVKGRLMVNGTLKDEGLTDDPMGALAWVANLAAERGTPLVKDMIVITGSVVATLPIVPGDTFAFALENIGETSMTLA